MFKLSGKGARKPFCINENCKNFLPEDKRGYKRKPKSDDDKASTEGKEKKPATKKPATKKSVRKKAAASKSSASKSTAKKTTARKSTAKSKTGDEK